MLEEEEELLRPGFAGQTWLVHKFGGTSVADAECFAKVAEILERQLGLGEDIPSSLPSLAIVVSAMGGKPKTTDILLDAVVFASERQEDRVQERLRLVEDKHDRCLARLFSKRPEEHERLLTVIRRDLSNIRDILQTVALMKWRAERISEVVSGYGELWSTQILAALLNKRAQRRRSAQHQFGSSSSLHVDDYVDHEFVYLDARRFITVDEDAFANGAVEWNMSQERFVAAYREELERLEKDESSSSMVHLVITGYVATNMNGVATTLQRDGSDYSAAIVGRLLLANRITIWTDVDGVLSADPRRVPDAQVLTEVSYNEAMELAYFGAKVIHPKTMQPALTSDPPIPIYIRNTFHSEFPGTRIWVSSVHAGGGAAEHVVCGFSSIERMALINVEGSGLVGVTGVDRRVFGTMERTGISVVLISQGSSEHSVTFSTTEANAILAKESLEEEFAREITQNRVSSIDIRAPCSIIAAVGDGMSTTTGVAGRFFSALGDAKINILAIAQGSSQRNISAVVFSDESTRALRAVHAAFNLSHNTVRVGIIGVGELGRSLLQLLEMRRNALRSIFDIDVQVCVVLPEFKSTRILTLKDNESSTDSITLGAFDNLCVASTGSNSFSRTIFEDEGQRVVLVDGGLSTVLDHLVREDFTTHCLFDCTNERIVSLCHAQWLRSGVDVITANNMGLSGPEEQRREIKAAEMILGKQSAKYLRQVTVAGGLPILSTLRSLLHSGDHIRRIDGIFTVVLSYVMYRISPPPGGDRSSKFDEEISDGIFEGDLLVHSTSDRGVGTSCSFSQAVKEAIALGLTEEDPLLDLNNEYTARVLMVLARELDMDDHHATRTIQQSGDVLVDLDDSADCLNLPPEIDQIVQARVAAANAKGCVLRNISSINVKEKRIAVNIVEVPDNHVFATTPPSCACIRFFTKRHRSYPLVITGPSAGADSTASALLAELLQRTRGMLRPRSSALGRTASGSLSRFSSNNSVATKGSK